MRHRLLLFAFAVGTLISVSIVVALSEKSSAKTPDVVSAFGKLGSPHGDLYVHVLARVPANSNAAETAAAAISAQGARQITSAEFSVSGLVWTNSALQDVDSANGTPDIGIQYNPANEPLQAVRAKYVEALDLWSAVSPSDFSFVDNGDTNRCPSLVRECRGRQLPDGHNDFGWISIKDQNTLAITWFNSTEADVGMNTDHEWFIDGGPGYDVLTVALHEFGHVAGLDHSEVPGAVMEANYGGIQQSLTADDVAGLLAIYGSDGPGATPTPGPTIEPGDPPVIDTIEVTGVRYSLVGKNDRNLYFVVDAALDGAPIAGAEVKIGLYLFSPSKYWIGSAWTDYDGSAKFILSNARSGQYHTTVQSVTLGEFSCGNCPYQSELFSKP